MLCKDGARQHGRMDNLELLHWSSPSTPRGFWKGPPQAPHVGFGRALPKHPTWVLEGPSQAFDSLGWQVPTVVPQACHLHPQEDKTK
jgi:hypothetical protein